jgi:NAD+--asparagine ADP-ribosyltransferase
VTFLSTGALLRTLRFRLVTVKALAAVSKIKYLKTTEISGLAVSALDAPRKQREVKTRNKERKEGERDFAHCQSERASQLKKSQNSCSRLYYNSSSKSTKETQALRIYKRIRISTYMRMYVHTAKKKKNDNKITSTLDRLSEHDACIGPLLPLLSFSVFF